MALKETFLERAGLLGCVLPTVVGGVIFAALGWWLMVPSSESEYLEGAAGSIGFFSCTYRFLCWRRIGLRYSFYYRLP